MLSIVGNLLPMEKPRPALQAHEAQELSRLVQELEGLLTINPSSHEFGTMMRQLDAASTHVNDSEALMLAHVRTTMLFSNGQLRSPQYSALLTRITSLRATLFNKIAGHYQNEQSASAALERFMAQFPDLQQYLRNDLIMMLRDLRPQAANPANLVNVMRPPIGQSSHWQSSRLLGQIALLWVVFRLLNHWNSPIQKYLSEILGQSNRSRDFFKPILQIISFSLGQIILSRNDTTQKRIIQSLLPSGLFILVYQMIAKEYEYFNREYFYIAMANISDILGLYPWVSASYTPELSSAISMLGTVGGVTIYENYEYIKRLLASLLNGSQHQADR